ncbi:tetratricopeptide repeat protein [Sanyastnella coralliicola]|uniref:tetratricopeptide repeat protein n=1 Tax=Sanyastnella coralliicola TaxID=3069118 RepID=UPI0027BA4818|nr:hypothetical protein [Longitalea sp. SCSIO 12813]
MAKPNNTYDPQLLETYFNGSLSAEEAHALEMQAMEDPFLAEAMEGFEAAGVNPEASAALKQQIHSATQPTGGLTPWLLGMAAVLVVAAGVWLAIPEEKEDALVETLIEEESERELELEEEARDAHVHPYTDEELEESHIEVVDQSQTDSSMTFTIRETMAEVADAAQAVEEVPVEHFVERVEAPAPVAPQEPEEVSPVDAPEEEERDVMIPGAAIYHLLNYKVVDYRGQREESWEKRELLTGTNAAISDSSEEPLIGQQYTQVAYVEYLEQTMERFAEERYSKAERGFKEILLHFPYDANGLFYGGLTAFYQGDYALAAERLDDSRDLAINTFREESEFYLALAWKEMGEAEQAETLLQEIIAKNGFYAKRASEVLED